MKFLKHFKYQILFGVFLMVVMYMSRSAELVFEWKSIFDEYYTKGGFNYLGKPTAYMPPFYFWYLLLFYKVLPFGIWIASSCVVQSIIYFFSVKYLIQSFNKSFNLKLGTFWPLVILLFFPPILVGLVKISAFALSCSIALLFVAEFMTWYRNSNFKSVLILLLISLVGLYLRYEFMFLIFLTVAVLVFAGKLKWWKLLYIGVFVMMAYLPWSYRNYKTLGVFHYSTSLSYNFAKGNHIKYDLFSSSNTPYDPVRNLYLDDISLREEFEGEKEIDAYLKSLNDNFVKEHPGEFIINSIKKIGVVLLNYYPYNYNLGGGYKTVVYAVLMTLFNVLFGVGIYKSYRLKVQFWPLYWVALFGFVTVFYSVAPLPRYYIFYFPIFFLVAYKWVGEYFWERFVK